MGTLQWAGEEREVLRRGEEGEEKEGGGMDARLMSQRWNAERREGEVLMNGSMAH